MNTQHFDSWEDKLRALAHSFDYPPAPDVSLAVRQRLVGRQARKITRPLRLAWAAVILTLILAGALAIPGVRAQIVEFIQIGVVRIFQIAPTQPSLQPSLQPSPQPTLLPSLLDLAGETTLEDARLRASFPIRLPDYPAGLGQPDHVFLQTGDGQMLVLVWLDPGQPDRVYLSLHIITPGSITLIKFEPKVIEETTVNGQPAIWAEGPYLIKLRSGDYDDRQLVSGNTLIWLDGELTYRLESDLPLAEAVKIAESLK